MYSEVTELIKTSILLRNERWLKLRTAVELEIEQVGDWTQIFWEWKYSLEMRLVEDELQINK